MQCACAMLSSVASARLYSIFSTLSRKWSDFRRKKVTKQILKEAFLIPRRIRQDRSEMYMSLHVMYLLLLSDCAETLIFSADFRKLLKTSVFMKIRPVGGERFHANGWTDEQT